MARLGQPGLLAGGHSNKSWGTIQIDDIYSGAASGQRHFVVSALVGDLLLVQADAYAQTYFRLTT